MKAIKSSAESKRKLPPPGRKVSVREAHERAIKKFDKAFAKLSK